MVCSAPGEGGASLAYVERPFETVSPPAMLERFHQYHLDSVGSDAQASLRSPVQSGSIFEDVLLDLPLGVAAALAEACESNWLIVVSDGAPDALILEWAGGPDDATKWQYRHRIWVDGWPQSWSRWQDVPDSNGVTRRYRLSGLSADTAYDAQVRWVVGRVHGPPSNMGQGVTPRTGRPEVSFYILEGDGETRWRVLDAYVTIPKGMRLREGRPWINGGTCPFGTSLKEVTSGSVLSVCLYPTCEIGRSIYPGSDQTPDVGAFFDRLSLRHPLCLDRPAWEESTNRAADLGLAAVGVAVMAAYAVAVWWGLRVAGGRKLGR